MGGPAAGGVASPTALAFMPDPRRPDALSLLVADDQYKIRTVDVDTLTTTRTVLGPTFGGPVTRIVPFNVGGGACAPHAAYATARKVCGVAAMPLDGDPARAMGVVAHPAEVGAVCVARDDVAVFTVGSHASTNEGSAGRVINVWNVGKEAVDAQRVGSTAAERVAEQLLEGGAEGEFYGEVKDYFLYSQLRAQGEDSTADRLAGIDKPVPTSEIPRLLRALGHYPSERELSDIFRELAVETSGDGDMAADPPATIGFDRSCPCTSTTGPCLAWTRARSSRRSRRWAPERGSRWSGVRCWRRWSSAARRCRARSSSQLLRNSWDGARRWRT